MVAVTALVSCCAADQEGRSKQGKTIEVSAVGVLAVYRQQSIERELGRSWKLQKLCEERRAKVEQTEREHKAGALTSLSVSHPPICKPPKAPIQKHADRGCGPISMQQECCAVKLLFLLWPVDCA
jgi:hypothetical protein